MNLYKLITRIAPVWAILVAMAAGGFLACSKMDDYKKYTVEGEVSYTGKVDSLKIYSGKNRVLVEGLLSADPKIIECRIFWNSRNDSISVPITRSGNIDTLRVLIENIEENVHNFEVVTYDREGNKSITVNRIGTVYGERYQASLYNRPINQHLLTAWDTVFSVIYGKMDLTSGVFATELVYTDVDNAEQTVILPISRDSVLTTDYKIGTPFKHRSWFLPDTLCIDTFYTEYATVRPNINFFRNLGYPFQRSSNSGRWGILSDWITNDAAKNVNGYGGHDTNTGTGVLSFEAGWGTPQIHNGKIYQTVILPPGKYIFDIEFNRNAGDVANPANNVVYFLAAEGDTLPNAAEVPAESIAFEELNFVEPSQYRIRRFEFTITETKQVSVGFVCNYASDADQFFNVRGIAYSREELE
ncbi:DUF4998 domain-containing protein [Parapedobacter tibetensis]|uniref:DUF4998 domain-containing protein n=1 Tax=Parapedobacter tibetensis TaxID=2972951 RepID=UPI00214D5F3E|nr:DUF4998 domain-containing protein [Parapedobacter tibetensis]